MFCVRDCTYTSVIVRTQRRKPFWIIEIHGKTKTGGKKMTPRRHCYVLVSAVGGRESRSCPLRCTSRRRVRRRDIWSQFLPRPRWEGREYYVRWPFNWPRAARPRSIHFPGPVADDHSSWPCVVFNILNRYPVMSITVMTFFPWPREREKRCAKM